jgi:hypothetical protein
MYRMCERWLELRPSIRLDVTQEEKIYPFFTNFNTETGVAESRDQFMLDILVIKELGVRFGTKPQDLA